MVNGLNISKWLSVGSILIFGLIYTQPSLAKYQSSYQCLKELMQVTSSPFDHELREGVGSPHFARSNNAIYIPELSPAGISGFYVFSENSAAFYSQVQLKSDKVKTLSELPLRSQNDANEFYIYDLTMSQEPPETISFGYIPYYVGQRGRPSGSALGTVVLPVFGLLFTSGNSQARPYVDPLSEDFDKSHFVRWLNRAPASRTGGRTLKAEDIVIKKQIVRLKADPSKPLNLASSHIKNEIRVRLEGLKARKFTASKSKAAHLALATTCTNIDETIDREVAQTLRKLEGDHGLTTYHRQPQTSFQ